MRVKVKVRGEKDGFFYDDVVFKNSSEELHITVTDAFGQPTLTPPPPQTVTPHGTSFFQSLKIVNFSEKKGRVRTARLGSTSRSGINLGVLADLGHETPLIPVAEIKHSGPGHAGESISWTTPFRITGLSIPNLKTGGSYVKDPIIDVTSNVNVCVDPPPGSPPSDPRTMTTCSPRGDRATRESRSSRPTDAGCHHRRSSRGRRFGWTIRPGRTSTSYFTDDFGFVEIDQVLGPFFNVTIGENIPYLESTFLESLDVTVLDDTTGVWDTLWVAERYAPLVVGELLDTASGDTLNAMVYNVNPSTGDTILINMVWGNFLIGGQDLFTYSLPTTGFIIEPVNPFNITFLPPSAYLEVSTETDTVDFGQLAFARARPSRTLFSSVERSS